LWPCFSAASLNDGKSLISIAAPWEKLESYVQIQQIRFRDRFVCEIHVA
jgi:LytS/YehU family sensor histidine kinase